MKFAIKKILNIKKKGTAMSNIDEISKTLGSMESNISHVVKTLDKLTDDVDGIRNQMIVHNDHLKSAHKRLDHTNEQIIFLKKQAEDHSRLIENYKSIKDKVVGGVMVISAIAGFVGSIIMAFFKSVFSV
jgi:uncharacterized protein YoxC